MALTGIETSVRQIYTDFEGRRAGLLLALTRDARKLWEQCDPHRENLALFGNPDGSWQLRVPDDFVPPPLPEPCVGINFARDGMNTKDWLALLASYSDAWLVAVAFFTACKLTASDRQLLFANINQHPTLYEIVTGQANDRANPNKHLPKLEPNEGIYGAEVQGVAPAQASAHPSSRGRLLMMSDIVPQLRGRRGELFWPADKMWYMTEIVEVKKSTKTAKVQYTSGEIEELDLAEIVREGHMQLLDD